MEVPIEVIPRFTSPTAANTAKVDGFYQQYKIVIWITTMMVILLIIVFCIYYFDKHQLGNDAAVPPSAGGDGKVTGAQHDVSRERLAQLAKMKPKRQETAIPGGKTIKQGAAVCEGKSVAAFPKACEGKSVAAFPKACEGKSVAAFPKACEGNSAAAFPKKMETVPPEGQEMAAELTTDQKIEMGGEETRTVDAAAFPAVEREQRNAAAMAGTSIEEIAEMECKNTTELAAAEDTQVGGEINKAESPEDIIAGENDAKLLDEKFTETEVISEVISPGASGESEQIAAPKGRGGRKPRSTHK